MYVFIYISICMTNGNLSMSWLTSPQTFLARKLYPESPNRVISGNDSVGV